MTTAIAPEPVAGGAWGRPMRHGIAHLRSIFDPHLRHEMAPASGPSDDCAAAADAAATGRVAGSSVPPRSIGVLICSYQRPEILSRGLAALAVQERRADDVIVVARESDAATRALLAAPRTDGLKLRTVLVTQPGTVPALNAGLAACATDVLAITDDDTVPHPDWLARILAHFVADPALGGLGGRDWCHDGERFDDRSAAVVGHLQWFGRTIGNHHLGTGAPREVDFLKGANMSYRAEVFAACRFDTRLRGTGVQPNEDLTFSISVRVAGWKLLYDPLVAVDHYPARRIEPRHYGGVTADTEGLFDLAFNEAIAVTQALSPPRALAYIIWSCLVGMGISPGALQAIRYSRRMGGTAWRRFAAVQAGKLAALRALSRTSGRAPAPRPKLVSTYCDRLPTPKP